MIVVLIYPMEKVHHQTSRKNARKTISTPWRTSNITETEVFWKNRRNDFHGSWCSWFGTRKTRWNIENLCEKHWKTIEFTKWWLQLKKKHRENWLLSFCDSIFSYKNLRAPKHFSRFSETLSSLRSCHNDDVPNLPSQQDLSSPKKNAATVHPSVGFCPPNLWVPMVGVLWSKKNLQIFMDGIGLKKLLSESSKGEDVFAPRSSGFCSGFLPWKKNLGKKKLDHHGLVLMAWTSFCLAKFPAFSVQKNTWREGDRSFGIFFHLKWWMNPLLMCYVTHNIIILFQWTIGHESFWWWMSIKNSVKFISRPTCGHVLGFTTTTVCWFFAGLSSGALCFRAQRTTWLATRCRAKRCTSAWITSTMWCFCSGVLKGDIRSGNGTRWVMKDKKGHHIDF